MRFSCADCLCLPSALRLAGLGGFLGFLRFLRQALALGPLGCDAIEKIACGLLAGVLLDERSLEGAAENRLPQRLRAFQLRIEIGFKVVDDGELIFDDVDNLASLRE